MVAWWGFGIDEKSFAEESGSLEVKSEFYTLSNTCKDGSGLCVGSAESLRIQGGGVELHGKSAVYWESKSLEFLLNPASALQCNLERRGFLNLSKSQFPHLQEPGLGSRRFQLVMLLKARKRQWRKGWCTSAEDCGVEAQH